MASTKSSEKPRKPKTYRLKCMTCKLVFESRLRSAVTCDDDKCWRSFIRRWEKGLAIPGLRDRLAGRQVLK
jgi:hypothetical protein